MRILLTTISLDPQTGGGCAGRTYHLARHLEQLGHQCAVASVEDGAFAGRLREKGVAVHAFGFTRLRFHLPHIPFARLASLVREAHVVHILGYWNMLSVATAFIAARMGKPYLLSAAGEFVGLRPPVPFHKRTFHRMFGRRMVRDASGIVAITALEKDEIVLRLGVEPRFVEIVPNGVEPPEAAGRGTAAPLATPYILFIGRLASVKGPDLLVEAFSRVAQAYPQVSLVMGGPDCGMRAELEARVARHGLEDRVRFTGHFDEAQRSAAYRDALFLVVPSRSEAMSLVALEAGMLATPVLLTESCGFDEVGAIGGGMTVATSVDGLAHGLGAMLAQPAATRASQGHRLQDYATRNFAWPKIAARLLVAMHRATKGPDRVPAPYRRAPSSLSTPAR